MREDFVNVIAGTVGGEKAGMHHSTGNCAEFRFVNVCHFMLFNKSFQIIMQKTHVFHNPMSDAELDRSQLEHFCNRPITTCIY